MNEKQIEKAAKMIRKAAQMRDVVVSEEAVNRGARQLAAVSFEEEQDLWDACKEFVIN